MMKLVVVAVLVAAINAQICCNDDSTCTPFGQICDVSTNCYTNPDIDHICQKPDDPFDPWIKDGWIRSNDYVFKRFPERAVYDRAVQRCQFYNGLLAAEVLRDPEAARYIIENDWIGDWREGETPWIGYAKNVLGIWRWVDGGVMNPATTAWNDGEPNNTGGVEDRARIAHSNASDGVLLLDDYAQFRELFYMCEVKVI